MNKTYHDYFKYYVLVWVCPCLSVAALLNYIICVFIVHDGYAGAYWGLLCSIWSTSLIGYLIKYRLQLKLRYQRIPVVASTIGRDEYSVNAGGSVKSVLSDEENDSLLERGGTKSVVFDLDDIFAPGERRFYLSAWGGLGIAVCIVGIMCGLAACVSSLVLKQWMVGLWSLTSAVFAGISVYTIITHKPRRIRKPPFVWNFIGVSKVAGKCVLVALVLMMIPVFMLSSLQECVNAYSSVHFKPPGKLYDLGGGQQMHLHCRGHGSPVVLLNHAITGQAMDWSWVHPKIANITKTCAFDRTGYGWSSAYGHERNSLTHAKDLHTLLQVAGLGNEPVIMVGDAQSVVFMRYFIRTYTQHDVCGLMCVDCIDTNLPRYTFKDNQKGPVPSLWRVGRNLMPSGILYMLAAFDKLPVSEPLCHLAPSLHEIYLQNIFKPRYPETVVLEYEHIPTSVKQSKDAGDLGDLPMITVTAGRGFNESGVAKLSRNSTSIYLATAPDNMIFHEAYSSMIAQRVGELVHLYKISGCNTFAPGK